MTRVQGGALSAASSYNGGGTMRSHVDRASLPRRRFGGAIALLAAVAVFAGGGVARAQSGSNVALGKPAFMLVSVPCGVGSGPDNAVDGDSSPPNIYTDKWCARAVVVPHVLMVDLGTRYDLNAFRVRHAGFAGEPSLFNTRAYSIQTSRDGLLWSTIVTVPANTANVTTHFLPVAGVRYVRLVITQAEQRMGVNTARIYEFEAWATRASSGCLVLGICL